MELDCRVLKGSGAKDLQNMVQGDSVSMGTTFSAAVWVELLRNAPEDLIMSEAGKRSRARAASRPKVMRKCGECGEEFGTRDFREHMKTCNRRIVTAKITAT